MANKKNSGAGKLIIIIIASLLIMTLIPSAIYCAVERVNPVSMVTSAFKSNNPQMLIGKWQNNTRSSAYEFYDDGTYESYFSTFSFKGDYTVDGDKLTLSNPASDSTVVYTFTVDKKTLEMTIVQEGGLNSENNQTSVYNKVDRIETKTLSDLLGDVVSSTQEEENGNTTSEE